MTIIEGGVQTETDCMHNATVANGCRLLRQGLCRQKQKIGRPGDMFVAFELPGDPVDFSNNEAETQLKDYFLAMPAGDKQTGDKCEQPEELDLGYAPKILWLISTSARVKNLKIK